MLSKLCFLFVLKWLIVPYRLILLFTSETNQFYSKSSCNVLLNYYNFLLFFFTYIVLIVAFLHSFSVNMI